MKSTDVICYSDCLSALLHSYCLRLLKMQESSSLWDKRLREVSNEGTTKVLTFAMKKLHECLEYDAFGGWLTVQA
jgi:hypothetical protein